MESLSPAFASPKPLQSPPQSLDSAATMAGRVPLRSSITSAPHKPSTDQTASASFTKQFHTLMEHQREVHSEERALWHTERNELYDRISRLEATLSKYQAISTSLVSSPVEIIGTDQSGTSSVLAKLSMTRSQQASLGMDEGSRGSGDEVWRGSNPERKPSRTFSDSSQATGGRVGSSLPSIAENLKPSSDDAGLKPSMNPSSLDANLDGIRFRNPSLAAIMTNPTNKDRVMTPQSPSPISPGQSPLNPDPPGNLHLPKTHHDPYTTDAGHTPLARHQSQNPSAPSSTSSTPKHPQTEPETERPPLAPHATETETYTRTDIPKPPSERRVSYFPTMSTVGLEDNDRALREPLTLSAQETAGDTRFLNELDNKLLQAAREGGVPGSDIDVGGNGMGGGEDEGKLGGGTRANGEEETGRDGIDGQNGEGGFSNHDHEQDEGPKLRIKRSMNFGSQLGSPGGFGRGF